MSLIRTLVRISAVAVCMQLASTATAAAPLKQVQKAPKRYTIEQFMATTSISGASFSKDEKQILFSSNESGIFNAYAMPVSGGKPVAMTRSSTDSTYAIGFRHERRGHQPRRAMARAAKDRHHFRQRHLPV
jgi:hypothetical protein